MVSKTNPVIESARFVYESSKSVRLDEEKIVSTASDILVKMLVESYSPRTWRTHPLHVVPPEHPEPISTISDSRARPTLDWIFLVSALNFSFWSELDEKKRFGVDWRESWDESSREKRWTGYWSLLAALNRAIDDGIPITDPSFYSSEQRCPDSLIRKIFKPSSSSTEKIPLLAERIKIMREVGKTLCSEYDGSFQMFLERFQTAHCGHGTALDLVKSVTDAFPSFRDQMTLRGRPVCFWKRAQILVAETWAAFYPPLDTIAHPILPNGVDELTMFADYRVPDVLHRMGAISYNKGLEAKLVSHKPLKPGSKYEISIRAASILAVEHIKEVLIRLQEERGIKQIHVNSVLIDFFLWDLAKQLGCSTDNLATTALPHHRTRSIWY